MCYMRIIILIDLHFEEPDQTLQYFDGNRYKCFRINGMILWLDLDIVFQSV